MTTEIIRTQLAQRNAEALAAWRSRINSGRSFPDAWTPRQRSALDLLMLAKRMHAARWLHYQRTAVKRRTEALARAVARADRLRGLRLVRNADA